MSAYSGWIRVVGGGLLNAFAGALFCNTAGLTHPLGKKSDLQRIVGSIPGIVLGSMLSTKAPEALLRHVLAATLVLVGAKLVFS